MIEPLLVVIVNYGLADHVERLLSSGALTARRVLLVDNASEPERIRELARDYAVETLLLERNHGFAGAVNRALAHAEHRGSVLLLNPDVHLAAPDVEVLCRTLAERELTAITPMLVAPNGLPRVGTAGGPLTFAGFARYFLFWSQLRPKAPGAFFTRRQLEAALTPEWVSMACLMLAPDAFSRYGPIPEYELVYAEDLAWGSAACSDGARFAVATEVRVLHEQGAAGASARWRGATARYAIRELGPVEGRLAVTVMWLGLGARWAFGRRI